MNLTRKREVKAALTLDLVEAKTGLQFNGLAYKRDLPQPQPPLAISIHIKRQRRSVNLQYSSQQPQIMTSVPGASVSKRRKFVADGVFYAELNEFFQRELAEEGYSGVEVRVTPTVTDISNARPPLSIP